jgi:hypothetical protein
MDRNHIINPGRAALALTLLSVTGTLVSAQTSTDPDQSEKIEEALSILPRVGTDQTPIMPTQPAVSNPIQPGLTEGEDWLKVLHDTLSDPITSSTLAEGAYLLNRPGRLVQGPNDLLIFVPNRETREPGEGPVLLLPCRTLEQLESEWTDQTIEVSGEIFTYHGRNQLLLSAYRLTSTIQQSEQTTDQSSPKNESESSTQPESTQISPSSVEEDPDVRDLLKELEINADEPGSSKTSIHEQLQNATTQGVAQASRRQQVRVPDSIKGVDEGTLILRRPGRMIRNSSGAWVLVFDNDQTELDSESTTASEFIIEPCRMLMRMEQLPMQSGDAVQLLVSGRVYTYKGAHYILPTLMQRITAHEINSLQ